MLLVHIDLEVSTITIQIVVVIDIIIYMSARSWAYTFLLGALAVVQS